MKKILSLFLVALSLLIKAQSQNSFTPVINYYQPQSTPCITDSDKKIIAERVKQNIQMLVEEGKLQLPNAQEQLMTLKLSWPLKNATSFTDSFSYNESNYVDHDPTTGVQDWNCGTKTYDGHTGTDISLWPFPWLMMDNKNVKVIAAAAGTIVDKHDGEFDRNCAAFGQAANYVIVQHSNGWQTLYFHLKKGSVTSKAIGASVNSGELLGYVGSSGNSTGVHLHFEVHDADGIVIDPYKGTCNNLSTKIWKAQPAYWRHSINKIMVTTVPTVYPEACPNPEQVNEMPTVPLGLNGYFFAFLSGIPTGDTLFLKILKPNSSVWQNYYYVYASDFPFSYAYWYWYFDLSQPKGTWKWQVTLHNKTLSYNFNVTDPLSFAGIQQMNQQRENENQDPVVLDLHQKKMVVFPSPTEGNLQVQLTCPDGYYELDLCNELGSIIKSHPIYIDENGTELQLDLKDVSAGVYQLHLHNAQTDLSRKVIVQ